MCLRLIWEGTVTVAKRHNPDLHPALSEVKYAAVPVIQKFRLPA